MDQGVRYVVTLSDVNVTSGLRNMEVSANRAEQGIVSLNHALRDLTGAFGVGFSMHSAFSFGKEALQGAADYETAVKRIKFASENMAEGLTNVSFINKEVDKFKIPLQSATDAYGKFLAMLSGSGIAAEQVRQLHDEVLTIGKVKGLDEGQLNAAAMNIGKMLEAGGLDARHFRPLEQQLSGIGAFVAKELGISVHQLAVLRNKGHMAEIDPQVLLTAIRKQAESLEKFLPESTNTLASRMAELDNAWLRFKNDLVFDNMGDIKDLFDTLKSGIQFLSDHREGAARTVKLIAEGLKLFVEYKALMFITGGLQRGLNSLFGIAVVEISAQTTAYAGLNAEVAALNVNLGEMVALMNAANLTQGQAINGAMFTALGAKNLPVNVPVGGVATGAATIASTITNGVMAVGLAYIGLEAMEGLTNAITGRVGDEGYKFKWTDMFNDPGFDKAGRAGASQANHEELQDYIYSAFIRGNKFFDTDQDLFFLLKKQQSGIDADPNMQQYHFDLIKSIVGQNKYGELNPHTNADLYDKLKSLGYWLPSMSRTVDGTGGGKGKTGSSEMIAPPNDRITGQRVINYNINIKEINGIKENNVPEGGSVNTNDVALKLRDIILSIVNDSQIRDGH